MFTFTYMCIHYLGHSRLWAHMSLAACCVAIEYSIMLQ
jgi:hypothetical protein